MSKILPFQPRTNPPSDGSSALCPQDNPPEGLVIPRNPPESSYPQESRLPLYVGVVGGVGAASPSYPQRCEQSSAELRRELERDLGLLGVCYKARFFRLFDLEDIALAVEDVKDAMRATGGKKVGNPAGLFVRVLEDRAGCKAFR